MNNYLPKITIVTPSLNQGQYIEQCILSVIEQNYPNLEYIIIDGGSTDRTVDIIKKYEKWLTYWVSEPDSGQSEAINKGLAKATGDVFNWLNSDDVYKQGALLTVGQQFVDDPNLTVLCGIEEVVRASEARFLTSGTPILPTLEATIALCHINQPPTFFRLSSLDTIGRFVPTELHYMMDTDLWLRYLLRYGLSGVKKVDTVVDTFRLHPNSKSVAQSARFQTDRFNLIYNLLNSLPKKGGDTEGVVSTLKRTKLPLYFDHTYTFAAAIDLKELEVQLLQQYFKWLIQHLGWKDFWQLYFKIWQKYPPMQTTRFYLSPLIKCKRLLFGM